MDLVDAIAIATRAPSPHNTQPWKWRVQGSTVDLYADRSRTLTVSDPDGRELTIGCGAALEHLLLLIAAAGEPCTVELLPSAADADHLARVTVGTGLAETAHPELVAAIPLRHTNRTSYRSDPIPSAIRAQLRESVERFGVRVHRVEDPNDRAALTEAIMAGDRDQMQDPAFRHELSSWMRPAHTKADDGMPADLLGQHGIAAEVAPLAVRTFDVGKGQAAKDRQLTLGSPELWVLATDTDDPLAWLQTGRALSHLTLGATAHGLANAYMNQPCEVPHLRTLMASSIGVDGHPQLVVRLGYADPVASSPRRPVEDVLISA